MPNFPVVNTSPLIYLSRTGLLHLLQVCGETILVPEAVRDEVNCYGPEDVSARALRLTPFLRIVKNPPINPKVEAWDLGRGETTELSWALVHPGTETIIDDLAARKCAQAFNIRLSGTVALVLSAKRQGMIPAARPVMVRLRQAGMFLSDHVLDGALALVGE